MLERTDPVLPSRDFDVTAAFYASLGFREALLQEAQYLILARDRIELHFFHHPAHDPATCDHGVYLRAEDVDAVSAEIAALGLPRGAGLPRFHPAEDKPWGMREAALWDPDGTLLRIGQSL